MTTSTAPFRPNGLMTFTTDFGLQDGYVGAMKGVALSLDPDLRVVDICHLVPPQHVRRGALVMRAACRWFPEGTVHVGVVDPGVGSERAEIVATAGGHLFVGPDNGLFDPALRKLVAAGGHLECWRIREHRYLPTEISKTFHGRDIFTPTAAALAAGLLIPDEIGEPLGGPLVQLHLPEPYMREERLVGEVIDVDRFGNAITNIEAGAGGIAEAVLPSADDLRLLVRGAYSEVPPGEPVALVGSDGLLEVGIRDGSAAFKLKLGVGSPVEAVYY